MEIDDAVVVGGGPAGLSAALYLARFRRQVVLVDAGDSRAARIPRSHNVAGFPSGIVGIDLLERMHRQVESVGVRRVSAFVEAVEAGSDGFHLRWQGGAAAARTVLLATGATDVEPAMPAVAQAVDEGALRYCPVCDGFEVIDREVGVLCNSAAGLHEAFYLRHFTSRLQVFTTAADVQISVDDRRALDARGIVLHADPAAEIRLQGGRVAVHHGAQTSVCDSLYSALGMQVHSQLAVSVGAECDADGYVLTDRHQQTRVPGLFVAGDVAKGLNQISVAIGAGAVAASAMHLRLGAL